MYLPIYVCHAIQISETKGRISTFAEISKLLITIYVKLVNLFLSNSPCYFHYNLIYLKDFKIQFAPTSGQRNQILFTLDQRFSNILKQFLV